MFKFQLNFDDDVKQYKDTRYIIDSAAGKRGVSIFIRDGKLYYEVTTSTTKWSLATELSTNHWQNIVMTWKKEEGLTLYENGAFRDTVTLGQKNGDLMGDDNTMFLVGRGNGNPPFKNTRMYISSLSVFSRFLTSDDIPYVFTFDDTGECRKGKECLSLSCFAWL